MANVVVDTAFLVAMFDGADRVDPVIARRVAFFVHRMTAARHRMLIPSPVLAEFLCGAGTAGPDYLAQVDKSRFMQVVPFDQRAAVELATHHIEGVARFGRKRGSAPDEAPWQKVKVDRQIIAIATMARAVAIYSDDADIASLGAMHQIEVVSFRDLPEPPEPEPDLLAGL